MPSLVTFDDELKACIKVGERNGQKFDALREKAHKEVLRLARDGDINHDEVRNLQRDIDKNPHLYNSQVELNNQKKVVGRRETPFEITDVGNKVAQV